MKIGLASRRTAYGWISFLRAYRKYVTDQSTVLEIGASTPENTREFANWCKNLIGVEYMKKRLPKNFENVKFIQGDWQKLSKVVKLNSVDVAVSNHVIEHIEDDLAAINELYKILKPGGVALINTPNRHRATQRIREIFTGKRKFPYAPLEHVREYIEEDLETLLRKSKFKKYTIKPVSFGLHSGSVYANTERAPGPLRGLANFWEIHLYK